MPGIDAMLFNRTNITGFFGLALLGDQLRHL